jgi:hypothetical protein
MCWEDLSRFGGRDLELWYDGYCFDLFAPRKLDVTTNSIRRLGWPLSCVNTSCRRRKNFTQRNLCPSHILRGKGSQICAYEAAK